MVNSQVKVYLDLVNHVRKNAIYYFKVTPTSFMDIEFYHRILHLGQ